MATKKPNLKKTRIEGVCDAMRCKAATEWTDPETETQLCGKHASQWRKAEGLPEPGSASLVSTRRKPEVIKTEDVPGERIAKEHEEQSREMGVAVNAFEVTSTEDMELAAEVIADAKRHWRELDKAEKEITRPMNAALKNVRDLFRRPKDAYKFVEDTLKRKVADYHKALEAEQHKALTEMAETGSTDLSLRTADKVDGLSVRVKHCYEVTDLEEFLEHAPAKYKAPNHAALKLAAKTALEEGLTVPGVRFYEDKTVASRSK